MARFTDLAVQADDEGIYDLVIDPVTRDFKATQGLESASFVSLFSDRRAAADEVADPMKRRGWIGNLISDVPGDNFGSGLWLYEQRRLTPEVASGIRLEAEASHQWMIEAGLAKSVSAEVVVGHANRQASIIITIEESSGNKTSKAYLLVSATRNGLLARI